MGKRSSTPVYLRIAVDVASRVSREEFKIGQKLSGRTTLAGEYNVSPETIRKAMKLLADMDIVEVRHGNGIYVSSIPQAEAFIERYKIKASINELKEELTDLMNRRDQIELKMNETMNSIVDYTSRFKNTEHISVYEYRLTYDSLASEKTIGQLDFHKHTGITLVGIRRNGITMLSPSPEEIIMGNDKLFYVGPPSSSVKLGEYLREIYGQI